ncbi:MAG: ABC transporter substrate-binding protein [Clostridia bacterium]|nr:ABC transporter substrate-binding protein [Clostridia bacterium]
MMRKITRTLLSLLLALTMLCGLGTTAAAEEAKSVNIAVTSAVSSLNPLLIDATEVMKYALSLEFLPLVELSQELEFVPQLAQSITTEDNTTFTIKLREEAVWSDGTPVTSRDVLFTLLLITSPEAGRAILSQYLIVGTDDAGMMPSGATEIEGVKIIDDKTLTVTTKWPTALYTFENNFGRYLFVLPEHVLGDVPRDQLLTSEWFQKPDVISGPYFIQEADVNHYIRYVANDNYFLGAPKIKYLNLNVTNPAQLLAGLKSGEIDLVQQTMASVLLEDYDAIRGLNNVTAVPGSPITNQSIFINVKNVPDVRIRQALLYGIPRQMILDELVGGNGELVDAFLCSASPYYSEALGVTEYDPEKAAALIAEATAAGANTSLVWYVNSDDATFVSAVELIAALFEEIGLRIEIRTVDLDSLMGVAGEGNFDVMSVQYTYAPTDPYTDMSWLLSEAGWTRYYAPSLDADFALTQQSADQEVVRNAYLNINRQVVEDCPMISAYVISTLGAVSNRLVNATPDVYGTFVNVHEWDVQ